MFKRLFIDPEHPLPSCRNPGKSKTIRHKSYYNRAGLSRHGDGYPKAAREEQGKGIGTAFFRKGLTERRYSIYSSLISPGTARNLNAMDSEDLRFSIALSFVDDLGNVAVRKEN